MPVVGMRAELQCPAVRNLGAVDEPLRNQHVKFLNEMLVAIHPVDKGALSAVIGGMPFAPAHITFLLTSVDALMAGGSRNFQNWTCLPKYLANQLIENWNYQNKKDSKLLLLLNWAWKLGLRSLSMQTFQTLTAICILLTEGLNSSSLEKKEMLDRLKIAWRQIAGNAPRVVIGNLPAAPDQLHRFVPAT